MADQFKIKGLDAVLRKMRSLAPELQKKGLRTAVRKGANIVKKAAVENASRIDDPKTAENIGKNIAVQFASRTSKRIGGIAFRVGVRGGSQQYATTKESVRKGRAGKSYKTGGSKANPGGDTWYWRLVEFGTSRTKAQPFLRPALENNVEKVTQTIVETLDQEIDKIVAKGR